MIRYCLLLALSWLLSGCAGTEDGSHRPPALMDNGGVHFKPGPPETWNGWAQHGE